MDQYSHRNHIDETCLLDNWKDFNKLVSQLVFETTSYLMKLAFRPW